MATKSKLIDRTRGTRTRGVTRTRGTATGYGPAPARRTVRSLGYRFRDRFEDAWAWMARTITPGGWFLLGVLLLALVIGLPLGWVELVAPGVIALVLFLLALLFLLGGKKYDVQLDLKKDRVVRGQNLSAHLAVENRAKGPSLPGQIDLPMGQSLIEIATPFLGPGGKFSQSVQIPTEVRAVIPLGPPRITKSSPIGIVSSDRTWGKPHMVYVYPETTALPPTDLGLMRDLEGVTSARIVNDDLAFHAIREYVPGDSRRQIHWKSTAKTGRLMVRQYDESVRSEMLLLLDNNEEHYLDPEEFELGVSCAASFGLRGLVEGRDLAVVSGPQNEQEVLARSLFQLDSVSRRSLMDAFAGLQGLPYDVPLPKITDAASKVSDVISVVVLVTGSGTELAAIQSSALAFPSDIGVLVVRCDVEARPSLRVVGGATVVTVAVLEDLRFVLLGRAQR